MIKLKILILSDIHGAFNNALAIYKKEMPDMVLFAGDGLKDFMDLVYAERIRNYRAVFGNVDTGVFSGVSYKTAFELEGLNILLTHGHLYEVKTRDDMMIKEAIKEAADIVIYGHTHERVMGKIDGRMYFNPGAVKEGKYGVMEINGGDYKIYHRKLEK